MKVPSKDELKREVEGLYKQLEHFEDMPLKTGRAQDGSFYYVSATFKDFTFLGKDTLSTRLEFPTAEDADKHAYSYWDLLKRLGIDAVVSVKFCNNSRGLREYEINEPHTVN